MAVKQVYFSTAKEKDLWERANGQSNFSAYIKDLMKREALFSDLQKFLEGITISQDQPASEAKLDTQALGEFF